MEQNKKIELLENERIDDLQFKGLKVIQNTDGFCFGTDAVLLANFSKVKSKAKVVDLGTGTGIIPILLSGKTNAEKIFGIEIQEEVFEMAKKSVAMNNLEEKIEIINGDIKTIVSEIGKSTVDVVTSNPPYMHLNGIKNLNDKKCISRHEIKCTLEDVLKTASELLKDKGRFYMIHRPTRLIDIVYLARKYRLEPKHIRFVHPTVEKAPNMVLIDFLKCGNPEVKILKPLIVYDENGQYTQEMVDIYAHESV